MEVWNKKMEESGIIDRVLQRRAEDIIDELHREMNIHAETPTRCEDVVAHGIANCAYEGDVDVRVDGNSTPKPYL